VTSGADASGFVLVSIGNSRAAVGGCDRAGALGPVRRVPSADLALDSVETGTEPVHLVSVLADRARSLVADLRRVGRAVTWWGGEREIPVRHPYEPPEKPGADRLVAALAAHRRVHGACVVIDAGTAVTVDSVAADGAWLGGAIAPGLRAIAAGLRATAPALPAPGAAATLYPATSSAGAVGLGVRAAFSGALLVLAEKAVEAFGAVPIVVTGGDADSAAAAVAKLDPVVVPELLLEGLAHLAASP
jgi:type III pantothenate kinase